MPHLKGIEAKELIGNIILHYELDSICKQANAL